MTAALRPVLLAVSVGTLGAFAWIETGTTVGDWLVRFGHVGAFALWLGGAVWHNGIVRPTMRRHPAARDTVRAQAKRFRKHLLLVVPALFLTGGYQIVRLFGPDPALLLDTAIGHLVLFKLAVLTALTAIGVAHLRKAGKR